MHDDGLDSDQVPTILGVFQDEEDPGLAIELETVVERLTDGFSPLSCEVHLDRMGSGKDVASRAVAGRNLHLPANLVGEDILIECFRL